jgi:predicted Zn-dependent protease with MMP-like domain
MAGMVEMSREDFEAAVTDALDLVPEELLELVDNVVILVEDEPEGDDPELLGLYDGVSLTDRGDGWGYGELPDRIFIYRNPTLRICDTVEEVREEVAVTVVHEIAHHFGIDDERLHELGWD